MQHKQFNHLLTNAHEEADNDSHFGVRSLVWTKLVDNDRKSLSYIHCPIGKGCQDNVGPC